MNRVWLEHVDGNWWRVRLDSQWMATFNNKADAEAWAEAKRAEADRPQWVPAGTGCLERVTLRHLAGVEVTVASSEADSLLAWLNSPEGWKP